MYLKYAFNNSGNAESWDIYPKFGQIGAGTGKPGTGTDDESSQALN